MGDITQYQDFQDLYTGLMNRAREDTGLSATKTQAKRYINVALHDMNLGQGEKFPWLERRDVLVTQPRYTTGTVTIDRGDTALTGSGTSWATANEYGNNNARVGGKITIDGQPEVYEVTAVGSDTGITLGSDFIGSNQTGIITAVSDSGIGDIWIHSEAHGLSAGMTVTVTGTDNYDIADTIIQVTDDRFRLIGTFGVTETGTWSTGSITGASYVYFEDEYALASDFLRPIDHQKFDEGISIDLVGRTEFRRRYPRNDTPNRPRIATIVDKPVEASTIYTITAFAASAGTADTTKVTITDHPFTAGDRVQIRGTTSYDGTWTIISKTTNNFIIAAVFVADDATGNAEYILAAQRRIRLHPPPLESTMIPYHYVTRNIGASKRGTALTNLERDDDEPLVPIGYRHAIIFHALSHWYRDKKDDARSQEVANEYTGIMSRIISDNEIGGARPQFRPRVSGYKMRARSPWRGGRGRYDLHGKFDRLER